MIFYNKPALIFKLNSFSHFEMTETSLIFKKFKNIMMLFNPGQ